MVSREERSGDQRITRSTTSSRTQEPAMIRLYDVQVITPSTSLSLQSLSVPLSGPGRMRVQKVFGPPNSLQDQDLDLEHVHHAFIFHKRSALPLCALILSILGSCWGLRSSLITRVFCAAGALGVTFGLLRQLELLARAGYISAELAAWTPLTLLSVWMIITVCRSGLPNTR